MPDSTRESRRPSPPPIRARLAPCILKKLYRVALVAALSSLGLFGFPYRTGYSPEVIQTPIAHAQTQATTTTPAATTTPETIKEPVKKPYDATACNCYAYVKSKIPSLPLTKYLKPNTNLDVGVVALFNYRGTPHYAIVSKLEGVGFWVKDSNFGGCGYRTHYIKLDDPALIGYWNS